MWASTLLSSIDPQLIFNWISGKTLSTSRGWMSSRLLTVVIFGRRSLARLDVSCLSVGDRILR